MDWVGFEPTTSANEFYFAVRFYEKMLVQIPPGPSFTFYVFHSHDTQANLF